MTFSPRGDNRGDLGGVDGGAGLDATGCKGGGCFADAGDEDTGGGVNALLTTGDVVAVATEEAVGFGDEVAEMAAVAAAEGELTRASNDVFRRKLDSPCRGDLLGDLDGRVVVAAGDESAAVAVVIGGAAAAAAAADAGRRRGDTEGFIDT